MSEATRIDSNKPLRVLNLELSFRLRSANKAIHDLRSMGIRVTGQDLRHGQHGKVPVLWVDKSDERLRLRCTSIVTDNSITPAEVVARFRNCDLRWTQTNTPRAAIFTVDFGAQA